MTLAYEGPDGPVDMEGLELSGLLTAALACDSWAATEEGINELGIAAMADKGANALMLLSNALRTYGVARVNHGDDREIQASAIFELRNAAARLPLVIWTLLQLGGEAIDRLANDPRGQTKEKFDAAQKRLDFMEGTKIPTRIVASRVMALNTIIAAVDMQAKCESDALRAWTLEVQTVRLTGGRPAGES